MRSHILSSRRTAPGFLYIFTSALISYASANCECGYSVSSIVDANNTTATSIFTDLLETDFLHLKNLSDNTDWQSQTYTVSSDAARGPYGKNASSANIQPNALSSSTSWSRPGTSDPSAPAGLQLFVRGSSPPPPKGALLPMAELVTARDDILYGSFRASIQFTTLSGTCGAFFWYYNDSQEIDVELLSGQQNASTHPVNLVLQSPQSARDGFNAQGTGTFVPFKLPFDPTTSFHEYRYDFLPHSVSFYADGALLTTMTNPAAIPTHAGHVTLSHWSNGDPAWSGGPPTGDAAMVVAWVKAYFNTTTTPPSSTSSSTSTPSSGAEPDTCTGDTNENQKICTVPSPLGPPGDNGTTFLGNTTNGNAPSGSNGSGNGKSTPKKSLGVPMAIWPLDGQTWLSTMGLVFLTTAAVVTVTLRP